MLSMQCLHKNGCKLCDLWPLCSCECHPEMKLESDMLEGKIDPEKIYDRMAHRLYCRSYDRANRRATYYRNRKTAQCSYPGCKETYVLTGKSSRSTLCRGHAYKLRYQHGYKSSGHNGRR